HLGWNWNAVVKPGAVKVVVGRRKTYRPEDIDWSKPIPDGPLAHGFDHKFDHWSSQPFRGLKRDVYEGGHRVPFIVKWPGVTKAGTVSAPQGQTKQSQMKIGHTELCSDAFS
ncbi:MAG: hypothetical protein QGG53_00330, partial [Planctomycetota bacterium]|nr:hypothetical protein [Planctomycetota bacterium]